MVWAGSEQAAAIGDLIQQGNLAEARSKLVDALHTRQTDAELWNLLGVVSAQEGKTAAAEDAFRKAVQLAPRLEPGWLNLGRLYQLSGATGTGIDRGIAAYETVLRLDAANVEAHHQLGLLLQWKGQFRESLAHLNRLPPEDRNRRAALALRCADEAALGHTAAALDLVARLLRDSEPREHDIVAILPVLVKHNEAVAIKAIEGLDARRLSTSGTLAQLAEMYERRSDFQHAREVRERLAQASPAAVQPLLELARVAWKQKDYEGTLGYLAHARDLEPANAGIRFLFGVTCNEMSLPMEAKKELEKALELAPDNAYYNYALGAVLLEWSDKAPAVPYLKKFLSVRPDDARGHLALATAYFSMFENDQAQAELRAALENPRTRPGAEYLLGRIAAQQDDFDAAIGHFRKLLALEPKSPEAHAELGSALLEKQDFEGARREADLALALDPDNYPANRTLLRLFRRSGDPRVKDLTERLLKLSGTREERVKLMQRTIEVRPW